MRKRYRMLSSPAPRCFSWKSFTRSKGNFIVGRTLPSGIRLVWRNRPRSGRLSQPEAAPAGFGFGCLRKRCRMLSKVEYPTRC